MSLGPGKYDDACTAARKHVGDTFALIAVMVLDPVKGHGFSVQCADPNYLQHLPDMLDEMAASLRRDLKAMPQ